MARAASEILVIGGGIAGLCAAIAARRLGADVRVIESAPATLRGGNARHARNFRIAHAGPVWHTPGAYSSDTFLAELLKVGGGANKVLARALVEESETCADWLTNCGVRLQAPETGLLPYSRRTAFLLGGGKAMINALYETAGRLGVTFDYDSEVVALAPTGDGWILEIASGEAPQKHSARALVLASGGPGADPAWRRAHFGPAGEALAVRGTVFSDGRLMEKLAAMGAKTVGDPRSGHMVAVDARGPDHDGGIVTRITAIPFGLVVNKAAEPIEVADAAAGKAHYAQWGPAISACEGGVAFLILDADGLDAAPPAALAPVRAATLENLAAALGLDGAALSDAVAIFNGRPGVRPIVKPPFAGFPMRAGLTFVYFGLAADENMRVVTDQGHKNLFAAGMIMAANIFSRGYLAGLGLTLSATTGKRAGEEAARHVLR